jgi:hypothetical protein
MVVNMMVSCAGNVAACRDKPSNIFCKVLKRERKINDTDVFSRLNSLNFPRMKVY